MPRTLPADLDTIMLSQQREPAWRVEVFDLRGATVDTMGSIVRDLELEETTGPDDLTSDVKLWRKTELASDFLSTGVAVPSIALEVVDPSGALDPIRNPTGRGRFLRRGNAIRLFEGDQRVDPLTWPNTFTGKIIGQPGVDLNRTGGGRANIIVRGLGREADFIDVVLTSDDFTFGQTLNEIALAIAQTDMGLDIDEIAFSNWGQQVNGHLSLQFVEISSLVAIANLMMLDGLMPRFDGAGKLEQTLGLITQNPDRIYTNRRTIIDIVRPATDANPFNSILVIGLEAEKTPIIQPAQQLRDDVHITIGYFTQDEAIEIPFSDDMRQLVQNVVFQPIKSANGGLSFLGGGETFVTIPAEIGTGVVGVTLTISTGFAPYLLVFFGSVYVTLAAIPDEVLAFGAGFTLPFGRIVQAGALAVVLLLMTKIGKGQYRFIGEPFEFVYEEISEVAELPGLTTETRKQKEVRNQVIQSHPDAKTVGFNMLNRQQSLADVRVASMPQPDLVLTADDVFEIPGPEQYQIQTIESTGGRAAPDAFTNVVRLMLSELTALGLS